jgi:hypothetical protein
MSALPLEKSWTVLLNISLLFLVSVEPYLLSVLNSAETLSIFDSASVAYALDLAGLVAILELFTHMLTREGRKLMPARLLSQERRIRNALLLSAVRFLVSTLPVFFVWGFEGIPLRVLFCYASLVILWSFRLPGRREREK